MGEKERRHRREESNVQRNMVRETARRMARAKRSEEDKEARERGRRRERERGRARVRTCVSVRAGICGARWYTLCVHMRMHVCARVGIVGVASVAADVAAVPRYRRGCWTSSTSPHDMIYQPCLLLPLRSLPLLTPLTPHSLFVRASSPRSSIANALRIFFASSSSSSSWRLGRRMPHAALRQGQRGRESVVCA